MKLGWFPVRQSFYSGHNRFCIVNDSAFGKIVGQKEAQYIQSQHSQHKDREPSKSLNGIVDAGEFGIAVCGSPTLTAHHQCSRQKPGNPQYTLLKIVRHLEWCNFPAHCPANQPTNNTVHQHLGRSSKYDSAGDFAPLYPIIVLA